MKMTDIVNSLNTYLKNKIPGFFVLHEEIKPHPKFKAYKNYSLKLWYINKDLKTLVITINLTERQLEGQEEMINNKLLNALLNKIYELIDNKEYLRL